MQNNELKAGTEADKRTAADSIPSASLEQNGLLSAVKCKHTNVKFTEEIAAMHQIIFEDKNYFKNNEYGNRIKIYCECSNCDKKISITHKNEDYLPKWVKSKIEILKSKQEWWLS